MRTTLTLDDDIARKLKAVTQRTGKSFKEVLNETLRVGLLPKKDTRSARKPFVVREVDMGWDPRLDYDNIGNLLEQLEGPLHK